MEDKEHVISRVSARYEFLHCSISLEIQLKNLILKQHCEYKNITIYSVQIIKIVFQRNFA